MALGIAYVGARRATSPVTGGLSTTVLACVVGLLAGSIAFESLAPVDLVAEGTLGTSRLVAFGCYTGGVLVALAVAHVGLVLAHRATARFGASGGH